MISYISGVVEEIEKDKVVVDNNGIGYGIFASQSTLEQIGIGEQVKIYTYFSVREDAMQLYGFLSRQELQLFKFADRSKWCRSKRWTCNIVNLSGRQFVNGCFGR
ncbi:MAG: Holliday junction branch migration protein RuvA [Eubacterium ventriosum]